MKENIMSNTALNVLQGILYTSNNKKLSSLVSAEMRQEVIQVLQSNENGLKRIKQLESRLFKLFVPFVEALVAPGISLHYVLRKKYIDKCVQGAIAQDFTQIVNLGAGFDPLFYRLSQKFPSVTFIEVDQEKTQRHKRDIFPNKPENLIFQSVDFTKQKIDDRLNELSQYDANKKTYFIAESVLMYLQLDEVNDLFQRLSKLTHADIEFVFTFLKPKKRQNILLKWYLSKKSEQYRWFIHRDKIAEFITEYGFILEETISSKELIKKYAPHDNVKSFDDELVARVKKRISLSM
jgi:methyltransferase (TIGR00027 family)